MQKPSLGRARLLYFISGAGEVLSLDSGCISLCGINLSTISLSVAVPELDACYSDLPAVLVLD
jgi:hypothetical protein